MWIFHQDVNAWTCRDTNIPLKEETYGASAAGIRTGKENHSFCLGNTSAPDWNANEAVFWTRRRLALENTSSFFWQVFSSQPADNIGTNEDETYHIPHTADILRLNTITAIFSNSLGMDLLLKPRKKRTLKNGKYYIEIEFHKCEAVWMFVGLVYIRMCFDLEKRNPLLIRHLWQNELFLWRIM